jgi:hypothetical protein
MEELVDQPKLALVGHGDCLRAVGGDSLVSVWLLLLREEEEIEF